MIDENTVELNAERQQDIDVLKGIGILLMVFDHAGYNRYSHCYISSFHMPLFFLISGYLWNNHSINIMIKKRIKSLVRPYLIFSLIYFFIDLLWKALINDETHSLSTIKAILLFPTYNMPIATALWFLPCMFIASIIYSLLSGNSRFKVIGILSISIIGTIYSSFSKIMLPFALEPVSVAVFFILIGEYTNKFDLRNRLPYKDIPFFILFFLHIILSFINRSVDMRSARYNIVPLYFLNGIMGTSIYYQVSRYITRLSSKIGRYVCRYIQEIGRHSIIYLCTHQLFLKILKSLLIDNHSLNSFNKAIFHIVIFCITIIVCYSISLIVVKTKFRYAFGIKNSK